MAAGAEALQRTPLHDRHVAAGARLVPFAGWEMPVQYAGIRAEHAAVRERAGVFDVSHMGEIETSGPDAEAFLQRVLSNDVTKLADGGAQYSVLCQDNGGVLDADAGEPRRAAAYVVLSVVGGIAAATAGYVLGRRFA